MTYEEAYKRLRERLQLLIEDTQKTESVVQEQVLVYRTCFEELIKIIDESERWTE